MAIPLLCLGDDACIIIIEIRNADVLIGDVREQINSNVHINIVVGGGGIAAEDDVRRVLSLQCSHDLRVDLIPGLLGGFDGNEILAGVEVGNRGKEVLLVLVAKRIPSGDRHLLGDGLHPGGLLRSLGLGRRFRDCGSCRGFRLGLHFLGAANHGHDHQNRNHQTCESPHCVNPPFEVTPIVARWILRCKEV